VLIIQKLKIDNKFEFQKLWLLRVGESQKREQTVKKKKTVKDLSSTAFLQPFLSCENKPYICPADHRANEIKDEQVCRKNNNNNDKINITVHS